MCALRYNYASLLLAIKMHLAQNIYIYLDDRHTDRLVCDELNGWKKLNEEICRKSHYIYTQLHTYLIIRVFCLLFARWLLRINRK